MGPVLAVAAVAILINPIPKIGKELEENLSPSNFHTIVIINGEKNEVCDKKTLNNIFMPNSINNA